MDFEGRLYAEGTSGRKVEDDGVLLTGRRWARTPVGAPDSYVLRHGESDARRGRHYDYEGHRDFRSADRNNQGYREFRGR